MRLVDSCKEFTDILKKDFNVSITGFGVGINGETQNQLNMTNATFSKYKEHLTNRGLIHSPQHGYVELILPRFAEISHFYAQI